MDKMLYFNDRLRYIAMQGSSLGTVNR